ncbi:CheR family methyltransferase [Sulfuricurvum sp.]|uniref:CheR family methyltransferase n=1 Tax=Sulfuricurvum sp. TaxID=2025608 RepID=UPI002E3011BE|nr:chemotaxis protein CheB [Sulfuricurvum sp.]HEX5329226.1 chemotaxis protein CheB [Sulfuricurvum sp.]
MSKHRSTHTNENPKLLLPQEESDTHETHFLVVGVGASAGGLAAFEAFFSGLPANTNPDMAFVLLQHLAPEHTSILTDIIRKYTKMKVFEVSDGIRVERNCVYVIPPGFDMAYLNGTLQLLEPTEEHGKHLPIDFFFQTLAQDQHEHSIGVILSGTGTDGTQGMQAIKDAGGIVLVQAPETTEYTGMLESAIATGLVDFILSPEEMMQQLILLSGDIDNSENTLISASKNVMNKIFVLLRAKSGHDFSQYKPNTIYRRIERRMGLIGIEVISEYVKFLQQNSDELDALFHDLLIGVTSFFRDTEAFLALKEKVIPDLFALKPQGSLIRIWTAGCSTGEEAYSIAILIREYMEEHKLNYSVQLFATDIDSHAIAVARAGLYPLGITASISPQRLEHFFTLEADGSGYRIHKNIRDMLIFSEQNIIKDPPFSKIDLISCRNLMIYLGAPLQKRLIPLFHYALNPEGTLFLGSSESIGEFNDFFSVVDQKSKLFKRKETPYDTAKTIGRIVPTTKSIRSQSVQNSDKMNPLVKLPLREITEQAILKQLNMSAILVNAQGDILYLHGKTGTYLELPSGEMGINNVLKMARDTLRRELTMALQKAIVKKETVRRSGLNIEQNGYSKTVDLSVRPVSSAVSIDSPLYLISIEETNNDTKTNNASITGTKESDPIGHIASLQQELQAQEEYLQAANDKLESTIEALQSSNEEMQSLNEELQSTNEELETSKEELQSMNEELSTVNAELQTKVSDLSRVNNDMNNLLSGTGIGTVFVDINLNILRYTRDITRIINLIASDVGRPIGHVVSNLRGYDRLVEDIHHVLDTLIPQEIEVQTIEGLWYTMRIQPYRTLNNVIEGAVISFVDITETVQIREALRKANEMLKCTVNDVQ